MNQSRTPKGVPTGGQFATKAHDESSLSLDAPEGRPLKAKIEYKKNGRWHREDGPAIIRPDGTKEYWRNGQRDRSDGPAVTHPDGSEEYWRNGRFHRADGPAITNASGTEFWYREGKLDRADGPAITFFDGREEYWHDGVESSPPPKPRRRLPWNRGR